ncbi:MAG: hypothetical protein KA998_01940 [Rickettsiaceae bacterium]|nr:hypothetical protein [Rickettsiaceae bacterium]
MKKRVTFQERPAYNCIPQTTPPILNLSIYMLYKWSDAEESFKSIKVDKISIKSAIPTRASLDKIFEDPIIHEEFEKDSDSWEKNTFFEQVENLASEITEVSNLGYDFAIG